MIVATSAPPRRGSAPLHGHATATARSPSTTPRVSLGRTSSAARVSLACSYWEVHGFHPCAGPALPGEKLRPARGRPAPRSSTSPGDSLHADFTRNRVERRATQQPQHHVPFPARAPPLAGSQGRQPHRRRVGADSGRPPGSLRRHWPSSFACLDRTIPPPRGDIGFSPNPCPRNWGRPTDISADACVRASAVSAGRVIPSTACKGA